MNITILKGHFSAKDAEELITKMIDIKIKYHENKIGQNGDHAEEDMKMREKRIKELQQDLYEARQYIKKQQAVNLQAEIHL